MFDSFKTTHYDSFRPDLLHSLVNSVKRFINNYAHKTPEFVTEVRRRLYLIHEYKSQVAKRTHRYPRSRKFDLLLVKYVELEYDVLYHNNPHPSKQLEVITELRVLRLLQVMLCQSVHGNQVNENEAILKRAVLRLLQQVKSVYLVENRLVCNIANKLQRRFNTTSNIFNCNVLSNSQTHKNLATSDYGTDDSDSDFENDNVSRSGPVKSDCVEVPLTVNGVESVPTIEFADDDDENYMVYLQGKSLDKTKTAEATDDYRKPECEDLRNNENIFLIDVDRAQESSGLVSSDTKKCDTQELNAQNVETTKVNPEISCLVICSDSEEECDYVSKKRENGRREDSEKTKDLGVVTFEILDDDDDDKPNYMVYLQKEVKTKKRSKPAKGIDSKEIVISDSDDDLIVESSEIPGDLKKNTNLCSNDNLGKVPESTIGNLNSPEIIIDSVDNEATDNVYNEETLDDIFKFVDTQYDDNIQSKREFSNIAVKACSMEKDKVMINNEKAEAVNDEVPTLLRQENMNSLFALENEISLNLCDNLKTNFLIDPSLIFEETTNTQSSKNSELIDEPVLIKVAPLHGNPENQDLFEATTSTGHKPLNFSRPNSLGGPLFSEKPEDFDDLDNLQECRINDSLLEQLLLDDSYLLEGRKEFEELECFLFNSSNEELGFGNIADFSIDNSEEIGQLEFENMEKLESFLEDSQLFTEPKRSDDIEKSEPVIKKRKRKYAQKRKSKKSRKYNPLKDFTCSNIQIHEVNRKQRKQNKTSKR